MANITEILGTDSVSSSRPIINSNLELLNDELASVTALLNPTTLQLSGVASVATQSLVVAQNGVNLLEVSSLGATCSTTAIFNSTTTLAGSLVKSGVLGTAASPTTQVTPVSIAAITYFVDSDFTLPEAVDGQELTIIVATDNQRAILAGAGVTLGATSITLDGLNSTITLRCFEDKWYVISSHNATIS